MEQEAILQTKDKIVEEPSDVQIGEQNDDQSDEISSQNFIDKVMNDQMDHQTDSEEDNDEQDFIVQTYNENNQIGEINEENNEIEQINGDANNEVVQTNYKKDDENEEVLLINDKSDEENDQVVQLNDKNDDEICDVKMKQEIMDEFDSFGDGASVYRIYRLRDRSNKPVEMEHKPEPIHLPPRKIRYDHQDNFPCDKCSKVLNSRIGLLNHMRTHIAQTKMKFTCAICQEQFDSNKLLIQHKIIHKDFFNMDQETILQTKDKIVEEPSDVQIGEQNNDQSDEISSQNFIDKVMNDQIDHQTDSEEDNDEQDFIVQTYNENNQIGEINEENNEIDQINCDANNEVVQTDYKKDDENEEVLLPKDKSDEENDQVVQINDKNDDEICDVKVKQEIIDEFDSFGDGASVYRKYRLRDRSNKPVKMEYKPEPIHLPPSKIRYDHQDNFPCDKCSKVLDSRTGLLNHMRIHIAQKKMKFTCAICQEQFDSNKLLIQHKIIHADCTFTCQNCQLAFTDHCDFLGHEISHTLRSFYKCAECGLYYNKTSYLIHINTHFDRKIPCHICHAKISKYNMQNHLKDHDVKKCIECNKMIKPSNMTYHMSTHTGVKLFQCLYCGKGFANSQQRQVHTRIHTNERPFECDICHDKFKQSGDMKKHRTTHFEGQYKCTICYKKFIHEYSYKAHMSVHNGTQRFTCDICGFKPSTHTGYKTHMLYKHSNEKSFKCVFCDMYFKTKNCLRRHNMKSLTHKRNVWKSEFKEEK